MKKFLAILITWLSLFATAGIADTPNWSTIAEPINWPTAVSEGTWDVSVSFNYTKNGDDWPAMAVDVSLIGLDDISGSAEWHITKKLSNLNGDPISEGYSTVTWRQNLYSNDAECFWLVHISGFLLARGHSISNASVTFELIDD